MQYKTEHLYLEDRYMQDKYFRISKVQMCKCTNSSLNYMNLIIRDHSLEYIQRLTTKFQNSLNKGFHRTKKTES